MKFSLDTKLEHAGGTSGASTYLKLSPVKLITVFGKPREGDEYKVSGQYIFNTPNGGIITLYDWKATSLYDDMPLSPEDLWAQEARFEFNLGGDDKGKQQVNEFCDWIEGELINSVRFIKES